VAAPNCGARCSCARTSYAGLTRVSINLWREAFLQRRWITGSSPVTTRHRAAMPSFHRMAPGSP
jgi:hypothetical protein